MRITSQTFYRNTLNGIEQQRGTVSKLNQELASGKSVSKPSDGPVAYASAQRVQANSQALSQYTADNSTLSNQLNLGSSTLNETLTLLSNVQSITLQALNGSTSSSNRAALAKQVTSAKQQMLSLANTQSNGRYLFAGTAGAKQPFTQDAAGNVSYDGDGGSGSTHISTNRAVTSVLSGTVFASVPQGNGYGTVSAAASNTGDATLSLTGITNQSAASSFRQSGGAYTIQIASSGTSPSGLAYTVQQGGSTVSSGNFSQDMSLQLGGMNVKWSGSPQAGDQFSLNPSRQQSVFTTIDNLSQALSQSTGSGAQRAQANQKINSVLSNLNQTRTRMLSQQATIGVSLRAINNANNRNATIQTNDQQTISSATDANIPKVITALNQHQNALTDAMKAFGSVSQLSLFKYL
ncbi:flagellar hook-associated protein FlgL [Salinisphaera sp. RV14]|uniref:flagellar hook-associated protein FlgL n=1 Tax=unclassified Salinisphaera TaxID=2649847 RepID=UPI003F847B7D